MKLPTLADKTKVGVYVRLVRSTQLIFVLAAILLITTSCQQAVRNFVTGGGDTTSDGSSSVVPIVTTSPSNHLIKISPGSQYSQGTTVEGQISITNRQLRAVGSQIDAKYGISQNRTN